MGDLSKLDCFDLINIPSLIEGFRKIIYGVSELKLWSVKLTISLQSLLQITLTICHLHGTAQDLPSALLALQTASTHNHWLLLHHTQHCPELLTQLPSILNSLPPRINWKLWLSTQAAGCNSFPMTLLKSSCRLVLESPLDLRGSMLHSLSSTAGELFSASSRQEWLPLLHNVALFHATVLLRHQAYQFTWTQDYHWTQDHLMVSCM